jgi:hypothetical protein
MSKPRSSSRMNTLFAAYTCGLLLPAVYRLVLPGSTGDILFYVIAFGVPALTYLVLWTAGQQQSATALSLLAVMVLATAAWLCGDGGPLNLSGLLMALKYYVCPILTFLIGFHLAKMANQRVVVTTLLVIACLHLIASVLFVSEVLQYPMYDDSSDRYTENWVVTSGTLIAFTGLTLSKFDLAYQIGFILTGLILFWQALSEARARSFGLCLLGLVLLSFTYNKTMLGIFLLALLFMGIRWLFRHSKLLGVTALVGLLAAISSFAWRFVSGKVVLTDIVVFLSPQTLLSRFSIWEEFYRFDAMKLFHGYGAAFFDVNEIVIDNQFLYSYLELGAMPALVYFILLAIILHKHSNQSVVARFLIGLLFCVFLFGDMLSSTMVMYVMGIILGLSLESSYSQNALLQCRRRTVQEQQVCHEQ